MFKDYEERIDYFKKISPYHFDRFLHEDPPPFHIVGRFVGEDWTQDMKRLESEATPYGLHDMSHNSKVRGYRNSQFDVAVTGDKFYPQNHICFHTTPHESLSAEATPTLWKMVKWLAMDEEGFLPRIHIQYPGQAFPFHIDGLTKNRGTRADLEKMRERPGDFARIQIQLQDWVWGHVWACGNTYWNQWRAGDIMYHPWWSIPHGTANCSWAPRYSLQVTGKVTELTLERIRSRDLTVDLSAL